MSAVQPIIGHLLSKYDRTAQEGVEKIITLTYPNDAESSRQFADEFIAQKEALTSLLGFLDRSCDTALTYKACISLLEAASAGNRIALCRFLCQQTFFGTIRKNLNTTAEDKVSTICGSLSLATTLLRQYPKVVMARLHREVPLTLGVFKTLTFRTAPIRPFRCLFLAHFALTSFGPTNAAAVATHGYLTQLTSDACELVTSKDHSGDDPIVMEAVSACLQVLRDAFVNSPHLTRGRKREILVGQRHALRHCVRWMGSAGIAFENSANGVFEALRDLVTELLEDPCDYTVTRTSVDDSSAGQQGGSYMPNFSLFSLLRLLHPQNSLAETRLAVFILTKAPDLLRPYHTRVAQHLLEESKAVAKTLQYAAVSNVFCRIASGPLPYHLTDPTVASLQLEGSGIADGTTTSSVSMFYSLTPRNVAEEVCPPTLGEFVHHMIKLSSNLLHLLLATQIAQAMLNRASIVMERVQAIFDHHSQAAGVGTQEAAEYSLVARDTYLSRVESHLREFLPSIEEFWHRVTQQLLPRAMEPKVQHLLQRLYVLARSYSQVLHRRQPWVSAVPGPIASVDNEGQFSTVAEWMRKATVPVLSWSGKTISCLCALLLHNLTRGVPLPKLHHITLGNANANNKTNVTAPTIASDWPPLLSLVAWFMAHSKDTDDEMIEGKALVVRLVLWCVHNVSLRFAAKPEEIYLWLRLLTPETAPLFLHMLNSMLQQSLSKAADRVAESLAGATCGVLHAAALQFIARSREKVERKASEGASSSTQSLWQRDFTANLDLFESLTGSVKKQWKEATSAYQTELEVPLYIVLAVQEKGTRSQQLAVLGTAEASSIGIPLTARIIQVLLAATARRRSLHSADASVYDKESTQFLMPQMEHVEGPLQCVAAPGATVASTLPPITALLTAEESTASRNWLAVACSPAAFFIVFLIASETQESVSTHVVEFCRAFLHQVARSAVSIQKDDTITTAFKGVQERTSLALLLTTSVSICAYQKQRNQFLSTDTIQSISNLVTSMMYTGTLSLSDRGFYATLLLLERCLAGGQCVSTTSDTLSSSSSDNEKDDNDGESVNREEIASSSKKTQAAPAAVLAVRHARYAIGGIMPGTAAIPEVDVLTQLIDGWSDEEVLATALALPRRLPHGVPMGHRRPPNLLRCLYPDIASVSEYALEGRLTAVLPSNAVDPAVTDDARILDPRYLFSLLRTVCSLRVVHPTRVPQHLLLRTLPFMIVGLSFVDDTLRCDAGIALVLAARCLGGLTRCVLQYIRMKVTREGEGTEIDISKDIPRLDGPVSSFLCNSLSALTHPDHPLHAHISNCFVTPKGTGLSPDVATHPAPLAHLLTEFPLACITSEQMLSRQEESYRTGTMADSGTTADAAAKVTNALRQHSVPHLSHILWQVRFSVSCKEDFLSLVAAHIPSNLFLLASSLQAAPLLRLQVLRTIIGITLGSREVAELSVMHPDVRLVHWGLLFTGHVLQEVVLLAGARQRDDALRLEALHTILDVIIRALRVTIPKLSSSTLREYYGLVTQLKSGASGGRTAHELLTQLSDLLSRCIV